MLFKMVSKTPAFRYVNVGNYTCIIFCRTTGYVITVTVYKHPPLIATTATSATSATTGNDTYYYGARLGHVHWGASV